MKKGLLGGVTFGIIMFFTIICMVICIERVPVGYEGVVYSMNGGVSGETIGQGWHLVAPTKRVKLFTVGNEQLVLTKDRKGMILSGFPHQMTQRSQSASR